MSTDDDALFADVARLVAQFRARAEEWDRAYQSPDLPPRATRSPKDA